MLSASSIASRGSRAEVAHGTRLELSASLIAAVSMLIWAAAGSSPDGAQAGSGTDARQNHGIDGGTAVAGEWLAGGYLGITHTHPSTVEIDNPGRTSMQVRDVAWDGKPFKSPIYYGIRIARWLEGGRVGGMLDFTHAKAISRFDDVAEFSGTFEGKPVAPRGRLGDTFKHLEFSHGHNMLTLNGLLRLGAFPIQPYVGLGAGISLPHTEIGFRSEAGRTYEYQYAGLARQVLGGVEVRLGSASVFFEYKLSHSSYDVPLSGVVQGGYLFTDLWRQARAWLVGEKPPGGRLRTPLISHHGIGGIMVRVGRPSNPRTGG